MQKKMLLFVPFLAGLFLMIYSWFQSFPLRMVSTNDVIFNHVSIYYWISVPLLLTSMSLIGVYFENKYLKWIISVGIVFTIYSLSFFYYMVPGVDEHAFRGLETNFIRTGNLARSNDIQQYYQWPLFFILAKTVTSVTGIELATYEFLIYAAIGILLATGLYIFVSKKYPRSGCLAVIAFFMTMFYFLNYQPVPFSFALALLFLLFVLTLEKLSAGATVAAVILFLGVTLSHAFAPILFVIYLLIRGIVSKSKYYLSLFLLTLTIYMMIEINMAPSFLASFSKLLFSQTEYSPMVASTLSTIQLSVNPIDAIAQTFSRAVTIAFALICVTGFILLFVKKKTRGADKAVFLAGAFYLGAGVAFYVIGSRAISIIFIPVSLGILYLFEGKAKRFLTPFILILVVLFAFIPLHSSFTYYPITFQTKEDYKAANFMIEKFNWNAQGWMLADVSTYSYILPQIKPTITFFHSPVLKLDQFDCIVYSIGLAKNLPGNYQSMEGLLNESNIVYDSGSFYVTVKSGWP